MVKITNKRNGFIPLDSNTCWMSHEWQNIHERELKSKHTSVECEQGILCVYHVVVIHWHHILSAKTVQFGEMIFFWHEYLGDFLWNSSKTDEAALGYKDFLFPEKWHSILTSIFFSFGWRHIMRRRHLILWAGNKTTHEWWVAVQVTIDRCCWRFFLMLLWRCVRTVWFAWYLHSPFRF